MKEDFFLTIGIPTYNRASAMSENLNNLINNSVHEIAQILIIDNDSSDKTFDILTEISKNTNIRILKNSHNLGYTGNIIEIINNCNSEYLIICSDEDHIIKENIKPVQDFLLKNKPLFVSSQFFLNVKGKDRLYRGRTNIKIIKPKEFIISSAYISGLIFKVPECKTIVGEIESELKIEGQIYPQVLIATELIIKGNCYWWNKSLAVKKYNLPSNISDRGNNRFDFVESRWNQFKLFENYITKSIKRNTAPECIKIAKKIQYQHKSKLFSIIANAIKIEQPLYFNPFIISGLIEFPRYFLKMTVRLLFLLMAINKPKNTI